MSTRSSCRRTSRRRSPRESVWNVEAELVGPHRIAVKELASEGAASDDVATEPGIPAGDEGESSDDQP